MIAGSGDRCKVMCTQPRRISAISIARRVSLEMGDAAVGSPGSLVGYQIRLESRVDARNALVFCTTGILLRRLETDPNLAGVTHVVVDEVHERTLESDFLLIVLRKLVGLRPDLKVILMSATLEARRFSDYFGGCPVIEVPGRTFPVEVRFLEDAVEETGGCRQCGGRLDNVERLTYLFGWPTTGYLLEEESEYAVRSRRVKHDEGTVKIAGKHGSTQTVRLQWEEDPTDAYYDPDPSESSGAPTINSTYAPRTLTTVNRMDPNRLNYDLLVLLLHHICFPASNVLAAGTVPPMGAVLVFLPGLPEIRRLHDLLAADRRFADPERCALYVLHSALASEGQEAAFEVPPIGVRKVVLATNIAETGVTIPDVTVVVDAGRVKVVRFDEKRKVTSLDEMFVSRASAKQRRGRAGRVQEGLCYHLFTRYRFENQLGDYLAPEMLRLPLSELCLKIKICRLGLIHDVLASALDPPPTTAVQNAIDSLVEVQALTSAERLTPLGVHLSNLPVDVHIGKMILFGAVLRCLDPVLTVAAYLSFKSPFIRPFGREAEADAAREGFKTGNSDLLTIYKAYTAWRDHARTLKPSQERDFCRRHFLSHQNLLTIEDMKKQFLGLLVAIGFVRVSSDEKIELSRNNYRRTTSAATLCAIPTFYDVHATNPAVLNAAFAAGLYPRVARCSLLTRELTTGQRQDIVHVHPSSVNFSRASEWSFPTDWLVYYTMVRSGKVYLWETGAVDACPLLMFGGEMEIKHKHRRVSIDHWIKFRCHAKTAVLFKCLRFELNKILRRKIDNPTMDFSEIDQRYLDLMVDVLEVGQQAK
ncbi:P-loop containing nucleoside triphosphate hydrolase protein [Jimgerdemannia flammicorona]|uniref:RNA helicase n=1 Tax=Jimgerdemannia flammicorona TaxID=994334 RepID=A0A433QIH3_9FUNG|nr:P-loop containing nucleoside triphosphate hydrolase protein [Jimgerdemannia flammicorona]